MTVSRSRRWVPVMIAATGLAFFSLATPAASDFDPSEHPGARLLVDELAGQGIQRSWLEDALRGAEYQQEVLEAMKGAVERRLRWDEYRAIFLTPERIQSGVGFIEAYRQAFERAEAEFGVPPEVIAAIIGVETSYGRFTGNHRVLDSLATLAFHHPQRGDFFRGELAAFLEISHEQNVDPGSLMGSYAGAMGYPQFIPTSYRAYAVDFDDDGVRDLWTNPVDAIGSVGNYFARHGWQAGGLVYQEANGPMAPPGDIEFNRTARPYSKVAELAEKGIRPEVEMEAAQEVIPLALEIDETTWRYRLGHDNFYVITRYNHSHLYAMAVTELAESIRHSLDLQAVPLVTSTDDEEANS
jgi:membrane-bound lytic murein transglycosylase B